MSDFFVFAESFSPNPQVARNTFDFFHLWLQLSFILDLSITRSSSIESQPKKVAVVVVVGVVVAVFVVFAKLSSSSVPVPVKLN